MNLQPTQSLEVVLEAAATTNAPVIVGSANIIANNNQPLAFSYTTKRTTATGTTPATVITAPGTGTQAVVAELIVYNADTVGHTITVQFNDNGTHVILGAYVLASGQTLRYSPVGGFLIDTGSAGGGSGTVTSVALTAPGIFSVTGSPITTSGTLALALVNQSANQMLAGPTSGGAATPAFRALVAADVPPLSYVTSVGLTVPAIMVVAGSPVTGAGTLAVTLANQAANQVWAGPTSGGAAAPTFRTLVAADVPALAYVTSVGLSAPAEFTVSGSPVTTSGTLTFTKANQGANQVWAGPATGPAAAPAFRALVAADIPALAYVTSVALSVPSIMSVAGSPITSSGTLAVSLTTQAANAVFAGPTSGGAAAPTFRALVAADIPSLAATYLLVANNLSDVASAATARTNLGLDTMATQNAGAVNITGGSVLPTAPFEVNLNVTPLGSLPALPSTPTFYCAAADGAVNRIFFDTWGVNGIRFAGRAAAGTAAAPTALPNAFIIFNFGCLGATGAGVYTTLTTASVNFVTTQAYSGTGTGTKVRIQNTVNGTTSSRAVWDFDQDGALKPVLDNSLAIGAAAQRVSAIFCGGPITTGVYTVATLPSAAVSGSGARAFVSDATAPTFGTTLVGGGAVNIPAYSDGAAWRAG